MTMDELKRHVGPACREVFERMMFLDLLEEAPVRLTAFGIGDEAAGFVSFQGRSSGLLLVSCSMPLARGITANLLGLPGDAPGDAQVADTLKEAANMICGSLFCLLDPEKSFSKLGVPGFAPARGPLPAVTGGEVFCFPFLCTGLVEGGGEEERIRVQIHFDPARLE